MNIRMVACCLLALIPTSAIADAKINYRTIEGNGGAMQSLLIGNGRVRSDDGAQTSVIFDAGTRAMIVIDHDRREYTKIGQAEMQQMGAALSQAMQQMEQALANVPPEMREQMKGMMGGAMTGLGNEPLVTVENTGRTETVAGHACTVYRTIMQGRTINESCMGELSALGELSAADRATLDAAMSMMREMVEQLTSGPLAQFASLTPFKAGRVPLRITDMSAGGRNTSEFAGVENTALPSDAFDVPTNYKEQKLDIPDLMR